MKALEVLGTLLRKWTGKLCGQDLYGPSLVKLLGSVPVCQPMKSCAQICSPVSGRKLWHNQDGGLLESAGWLQLGENMVNNN